MNKIEKLTQAITDFFAEKGQHYGYDDETIKEMLRTIDFHALHRLIRREVVPVRSFIVGGEMPDILRYRGSDLLPQRRSASTPTRTLLQSAIVWSRNTGWNYG